MALTTRKQFKQYCLRALGDGAVTVNVTDEQVEDRIDEALDFWQQHHFESTEHGFYKHQLTAEDRTNQYITLPDTIIGVGKLLHFGTSGALSPLLNVQYQIRLNDFFNFIDMSMVPYYMAMRRIAELDEWLNDYPTWEYTRHGNKLYVYIDWDKMSGDEYLVVECRYALGATSQIWQDHWLQRYTTALIKRQLGTNLKKYSGVQMPGGITFNGQQLYDEAMAEIEKMEFEVKTQLQTPMGFYIG